MGSEWETFRGSLAFSRVSHTRTPKSRIGKKGGRSQSASPQDPSSGPCVDPPNLHCPQRAGHSLRTTKRPVPRQQLTLNVNGNRGSSSRGLNCGLNCGFNSPSRRSKQSQLATPKDPATIVKIRYLILGSNQQEQHGMASSSREPTASTIRN
jgi:hypothetical protein